MGGCDRGGWGPQWQEITYTMLRNKEVTQKSEAVTQREAQWNTAWDGSIRQKQPCQSHKQPTDRQNPPRDWSAGEGGSGVPPGSDTVPSITHYKEPLFLACFSLEKNDLKMKINNPKQICLNEI